MHFVENNMKISKKISRIIKTMFFKEKKFKVWPAV